MSQAQSTPIKILACPLRPTFSGKHRSGLDAVIGNIGPTDGKGFDIAPPRLNSIDEIQKGNSMKEDNRRSFVKKSLATSMTFTFGGLIRAHGEEGGSTTFATTVATTEGTTVYNPDETTEAAADSGGTTTWDPCMTTLATVPPEENTWNPEETTADSTTEVTTEEVTSLFKCKKLCNNNPRVSHYGWGVDPDTDRVIYFKVLECKCTSGHLMEGERRTGDKTTPYANNEFGDLISHQSYGTAPPPAHTDSHGPCNH